MASPERKASSLLTLIASKAIVSGSFASDAKASAAEPNDDQRTQSMMYAARMKYLDDADQVQPDSLFMTRKQAQKAAQRHDTSVTLKKLDAVGPQSRKANATSAAASAAGLVAWKKANNARASGGDERNQVWEAKFQAGCHFWQNVETAECRTTPPPSAQHVGGDGRRWLPVVDGDNSDEEDGDDGDPPPFPDSFGFLDASRRAQ